MKFAPFVFFLSILLVAACAKLPTKSNKTKKQPNIIVILVDDMGYADVGFNGCKDIPTPNIDRIAHNGVKFTNGYVSYAVCGPSRAGLITGRYQGRFGFSRNPLFAPNDPNQGLPLTEETLAKTLDKVGYQTMAIGKWHLGAHASQRPLKRGFDEFFGFLTGGHRYFPEEWTLKDISQVNSQNAAYRTKLLKNDTRIEETEYLTDALSREATSFVARNTEQPFFLYLAYNAPHTPMQASDKYLDRFVHISNKRRKTYAAMVSAVDDGVGLLLDKVESLDLEENTMIFFLSDNGGPEHRNASDNGLLRGKKGDLLEGGIRVPFALQWKGKIPAGKVYEQPIISLDIFATAIKYANAQAKNPLDGVDLIPFITGIKTEAPHSHLFWRKFDANGYAVRAGNLKLLNQKGKQDELYDLPNDIGESEILKRESSINALKSKHEQWKEMMKDPVFLGLMQNKDYNKLHPNRFVTKPY